MTLKLTKTQDISRKVEELLRPTVRYSMMYHCFFRWTGSYWERMESKDLDQLIFKTLQDLQMDEMIAPGRSFDLPYVKKITEMFPLISKECFREEYLYNYCALADCYLNLSTFTFEDCDPNKFVMWHVPFTSDELSMPTPYFDKYLKTTFVDPYFEDEEDGKTRFHDPELANVFMEVIASLLIPSFANARLTYFVGQKAANGKSVALSVIYALVGKEFYLSCDLDTLLSDQFIVPEFIGKRLNAFPEEESRNRLPAKIKAFIFADTPMLARRKFQQETMNVTPKMRLIFSANQIPSFEKFDAGLKRRLLVIPFNREFSPSDYDYIPDISDRLLEELPGIFGKALAKAKEMATRKFQFSECEQTQRLLGEVIEENSTAVEHFNNFLDHDPIGELQLSDEVYPHYVEYCKNTGRKSKSLITYAKELKNLCKVQEYRAGGTRFKRVKWKNNQPPGGTPQAEINVASIPFSDPENKRVDNPALPI